MHIGYVLKKFPRNSETFILNEVLELQRAGADVTVFSLNRPDDGVFHRGLSELKRPVVYLTGRKPADWLGLLRQNLGALSSNKERLWDEFRYLLEAERPDTWNILSSGIDLALRARELGIDRLHAHFATIAAYVSRAAHAMSGIPYSVTCHAKDIYREGVTGERFTSLLRESQFVVTVCEANRRYIEEHRDPARELDLRVLYNGVDVSMFNPQNRAPDAEPTILSVGRLVEKKGFHILLDAMALLKDRGLTPRCWILGDGEEREQLRSKQQALQLSNVEFLGMRNQDDVRSYMARASAMVLPCIVGSDGNRDALPTVLLEALASGLPIVSTPVGGVEEIADHGKAGIIVPPGDAESLANEIESLLNNSERQRELAQTGRTRAESCFDLATNVRKLLSWFEQGQATPKAT